MQLRRLAVSVLALLAVSGTAYTIRPTAAHADGEVSVRGAYYKERATRVNQPMIDATFDAGDTGRVDAHFLVDAITSASGAAGASGTAFTENRLEFGVGYLHGMGIYAVGGSVRYSDEPDYKSLFGSLRGRAELGEKNTTITVAVGAGSDDISNASSQGAVMSPLNASLTTRLGSVSVSQILSPVVVAAVTYDLAYLTGFQENPYRLVAAGGSLVPERVPRKRYRNAVLGSVRGYVPQTRSTLIAGYRFYADSWGIIGHTPELRAIQEIVPNLDVHARYRFHRQRGADFFEEIYNSPDPSMQQFLTADEKLGPMTTHTLGIKGDVRLDALGAEGSFAKWRIEALFEYLLQNTDFGNAIAAQLAVSVPFQY